MSSVASHQSNKRSISSAIASFFKKETPADYYSSGESVKPSSITANFEDVDTTDLPSVPDLVLFESENGKRPLLLPIIPLQRLKILRQKQYLRHLQDSQLCQLNRSVGTTKPTQLAANQLVPLRSLKRKPLSKTERTKLLSKNPHSKNRSCLGKRWTGDFEYDLSEYNTVKKPKVSKTSSSSGNEDPTSGLESPRLSPGVLKKGTMGGKRITSNGLSKTQLSLLNGKSLADLTSTKASDTKIIPPAKETDPKKTKPFLALPSSGFDFLKPKDDMDQKPTETANSDASKVSIQPLSNSSLADTTNAASAPAKSSFSFGKANSTETTVEPKLLSTGVNDESSPSAAQDNNDSIKQSKPIFSFGKPATNQNDLESKQNDANGLSTSLGQSSLPPKQSYTFKPAEKEPQPNASTPAAGTAKDTLASKPAFDFGAPKSSKPAFDFGSASSTKTSTAPESDSASRPAANLTFSFGASKEKPDIAAGNNIKPPAVDEVKKVPSFSFGASKDTLGASKDKKSTFGAPKNSTETNTTASSTPFTFGASKNTADSSKPGTPFEFSKQTKAAPAENAPGAQQVPSFSSKRSSDQATGSDQKNFAPGHLSSNPAVASQSFSFGQTAEANKPARPTFSFGSGPQANARPSSASATGFKFDTSALNQSTLNQSTNNSDQPKSSFSTGSSMGAGKPAFSFGNPNSGVAAPQPQPSTSSLVPSSQNNGFSFGSGSTTGNNSPAFGGSTNNQPVAFNFGAGNTTASSTPPPFGLSNAPSFSTTNPQSRPFSPSNNININFGGVGSQNPSSIFGGTAGTTPAQVFGGPAPNAAQPFGGANQNPAQIFGGSNMGGLPQPQGQTPMLNLPPGRKLARMRARRG
ncbi:LAME_0D07096g1_1 [Lachancea meyersii CBS 8951]|uniref:LAME_0D07096g1_1 n=1 Tax=Lachancea meyersii CBS 8951 TaxID=1266667 RepID=A0A1G4J9H9_9SACH|nr:LAME_0D07096g1_1 [Lachancea meyersii CBS 8951]